MTTIVYRDGVLAADSRAYSGDKTPIGTKTKIHRREDGAIYGISTNDVGGDKLLRKWVEEGCNHPSGDDLKPDCFSMLLVDAMGQVFFANDNLSLSGPLEAEYFAIGTGREYALAAFYMGATAVQAIEVAKHFDVWSGGATVSIGR